jgi:hypothetical protein
MLVLSLPLRNRAFRLAPLNKEGKETLNISDIVNLTGLVVKERS